MLADLTLDLVLSIAGVRGNDAVAVRTGKGTFPSANRSGVINEHEPGRKPGSERRPKLVWTPRSVRP